ncbi:FMN-binding domain protein, partial [Peptostreptococcaceae bacterium AS15]
DALEQAKGKTTKPGESEYAKKNQKAPGGGGGGGGGSSSTPKEEKDFTDLVDGIYEGQAKGHYNTLPYSIKVRVTVSNKKIAKIELIENKDDQTYFDQNKADKIAKNIIDKQSTKVDTIAGATRSSTGFINAVANALEFAGRIKIISKDTDGKNKSILTGKITGQNITVKNLTVNEDLTIDKQVGDSNVTLENVTVKANLNIHGGGSNSIILKKVTVEGNTLIQKDSGQKVRLLTQEDSQLKGKVLINTPAIIETVGNDEIQTVEIPRSYSGQEQTLIRAKIGTLDIKTLKADIKIEKQSKIKHIELPKNVGQYKQGQNKYEKEEFKLEIEEPGNIQSGSNKNVVGTFKFLTKDEVKKLDNKSYKDGEYFGDGFGFVERKPIPVKVTVSGGKITDISLVEEELTKVDTEWKAGQKAKIDDGESYALRFDYVKDLVKKNQNPNAIAYRLGTLRDVFRLARKGVGATDIAAYNANLDKIVGKHEFGYHNQKLQAGDEHNINNKLMLLLRTFAVEDLGYDKQEYDAVSGATFTAIGTSQAISNALKKADDSINFYDMRVKDGYKDKFVEGKPIDLSDLKVDFYLKDKTVKTVSYSEFEANGLKVLDRDTDKEIKNGTKLTKDNFGVNALSVVNLKIVHEESKSVKLLKKMTVLKGGVLANIEKFQVKPKNSSEWIDTEGFDNTVTNGELNDAQHLKFPHAKAQDLLHKELEFRIIAKRSDNNEQVIFTTRPVNASDKFIYPQKSNQAYRIYINEDSLKDAKGTALKVDEKNSKYFRIFLKDNSNTPKLSETYKEVPSEITVTTGTVLTEDSLKAAFKDLPAGSKLNFDTQKAKELTESVGDNKKLDVSIDFTDYSSKEYTVIINVKEQGHSTLAQQYNETAYTITVTTNTQLSVERVKSALPNLPYNTDVQITKEADTSKIGNSEVQVRLTFTDNSTKDMTIPVIVKETAQGLAGKFEQNENALSMDAVVQLDSSILSKYSNYEKSIEDTMKLGLFNKKSIKEELRLRENVSHKEYGDIDNDIDIEIVKEPDQKTIGQKSAKIKLIFKKDGSELELDVPVNVTPIPVARFSIIPRYLKDMKKTYSIDDKFDFKGLKVMTTISSGKNANKWIDSGITIPLAYEDFEYFGLKVVKTGTNEEVKQGSLVKNVVEDGKIGLSVYRELGVITKDAEKIMEIKGLKLEELAESFNKSSYATNGIDVETLVRPDKYKNLKVYDKKGFDSSLKLALKEIEKNYGKVEVEEVSKPDLTQLGDTTAKIKLKFKDNSVSNEINVKVKVKELPLYHFAPYSTRMKKSYGEDDEIDLDKLIANLYVPGVSDNGEYLDDDRKYEELKYVEYENFKYFNLKIVKKDTTTEVPNKTKIKDIMTADKKIQLEAYCEKIYTTEFSNRQFIKGLSVK